MTISMSFRFPFAPMIFLFSIHFPSLATAAPKIGIIGDFSAKMALWGHQTQLGATLAKEDLKSQGIDIELIFEDTALIPNRAVSAAQKLISADKVQAIYAELSPNAIAASPIAKKARMLFVYEAAAMSVLQDNPFSFKSYVDFQVGCEALAQRWKSDGVTKAGILRITSEAGDLCFTGAKKVFPDLFVTTFNTGETVSTQLLAMKSRGIEVVFNIAYEPDIFNTIKAFEELNYTGKLGTNESSLSTKTINRFPKIIPQLITIGLPDIDPLFIEKIKRKDPNNTGSELEAAALAFLHIRQIARALVACPEGNVECQIQHLSASPPDTTIQFRGWKGRIADIELKLKDWKNIQGSVLQRKQ